MSKSQNEEANLSFEWDSQNERLEIHGDREALMAFAKQLESLASNDSNEHFHLMTADWGGNELLGDQQNSAATLIHHVKIFLWK